jgi:hypothetical protein
MKKYISLIFLTLAVAGSSCKKDFLNLQTNPNSPSVAAPSLLLSGALKTTAGIVNGGGYTMYANWVNYLSWSTGYQANVALEQYSFTTSSYDVFTPNYINISNYNAILSANAGPYYSAIAKIMIAFDYEALVDNYNDVPYSQAETGTNNLTPAYDSGQTIYNDLVVQLDAAIKLIQGASASTVNPGSADIMYGGNMNNWIKFANTLKLRIAVRQSTNANNATANTAAAATASLGYIDATSPAVVNPGYLNVDANGGQESPLWINYGFNQSGAAQTNNQQYQANSYLASTLGTLNDPRLIQIYSNIPSAVTATNVTGGTVTVQSGQAVVATYFGASSPPQSNGSALSVSKFGPGVLKSATMNAIVLSAAESLFLQAEANAKGIISTGAPATLYNSGIAASFADDLVPSAAAAAATYSAQSSVAYPTAGTFAQQQQAIITQKWIALAGYGSFEAFNELRRTGYPNVPLSIYPGANAPNQVKRIFYPFVEYQTNSTNVPDANSINKFTSKIFWAR